VTHDQLEALTMADRIAIMRDGVIEQIGTPHDVFAKPANVFVGSFIGTPQMNLIDGSLAALAGGVASVTVGDMKLDFMVDGAGRRLQSPKTTIGIRPRAFAPVSEKAADTMTVTAELIEPMGAETLIHARGKTGEDIRVVVQRQMKVKIGETMHLRADPRQTHLFDDQGRAVRA